VKSLGRQSCESIGARPARRAVASLLSFGIVLAALTGSTMVLCSGFDGHVAVEWALVGACSSESLEARSDGRIAAAPSSETAGEEPPGQRCCGACTDTLLIAAGELALKASSAPSTGHLVSCLPQAGSASISGCWQLESMSVPVPPGQLRDLLRATVIRC